jgi:fatty acid desaturase
MVRKLLVALGIFVRWLILFKNIKEKMLLNKKVKDVYESRWVWYHTILVVELFLIIIIQLLILVNML